MALNRLIQALSQQQNAQPAQPALGNLLKTTPATPTPYQMTAPAPFQSSSTPWQQQLSGAIDMQNSSGDAWKTIGQEGVINYMGDSLMKRYGTNKLSDFRYVEDASVPGGYRLDWAGRQAPTGFLSGLKNASRSTGLSMGAGAGDSGDGLGGGMEMQDPSKGLSFGATWEGEGGTTFGFKRNPDGTVGIETHQAESNDKGDIIAALATLAGGYALGTGLAAGAGAGAAGAGAAEGAAAAGAAGGAGTAAGTAGLIDLGGGLAMTADGAIVGSTMAGGAGMSGAALEGFISGAGLGGSGAMGAGAAGMTDLGGGLSMGADGAITGATGLNPSTLSNAGLMESFGTGGSGVAGLGGAGGAGTPPPANPYHPASYLNTTNLGNLASSAMSNFSWTDLIGPGLQLVGGAMNAKAAGDASDAQLQAAREAAARFEPWRQAGAWGVGRAATMLGKEGPEAAKAAFAVDPGYQWRVDRGENALTRMASARGLLGSGKFLKDAMRFNQGEASQEFGNAYNRLTNLAGLGQTATQSSADYLTQGANAQAAGRVGSANAWGNALSQGYSMYANQQQRNQNNALMNRVFGAY